MHGPQNVKYRWNSRFCEHGSDLSAIIYCCSLTDQLNTSDHLKTHTATQLYILSSLVVMNYIYHHHSCSPHYIYHHHCHVYEKRQQVAISLSDYFVLHKYQLVVQSVIVHSVRQERQHCMIFRTDRFVGENAKHLLVFE